MNSKENPMNRSLIAIAITTLTLTLAGCANAPYKNTFSSAPKVNNTHVFQHELKATRHAVVATLTRRGFHITHNTAHQINAKKSEKASSSSNKTYKVKTQTSLAKLKKHKTRITLVAGQKTVLHQTTHTWFHLLFLIPIFPTGTHHSTHVTNAGTIQKEHFYTSFFNAVSKRLQS